MPRTRTSPATGRRVYAPIDGLAVVTRADGRLQVMVPVPGGDRKAVSRTAYGELALAVRAMRSMTLRGITPPPRNITVGQWLTQWMAECVEGGDNPLAATTARSYRSVVANHVRKSDLDRTPLAAVHRADVQAFQAAMLAKGLKPSYVNQARTVLMSAFNEAWKRELLLENPIRRSDPVTRRADGGAKRVVHLTQAEIEALMATLAPGDRLAPVMWFLFGTGLRWSEMLGVRDQDIVDGRVVVHGQRLKDGRGATKTMASDRVVPLQDMALLGVRLARRQQAADKLAHGPSRWAQNNPEGYVFTQASGKPMSHTQASNAFQARVDRAVKAQGIPRITPHGCRHSYATLLMTQGEELAVISKLLGHSSLNITLAIYAHLDPARADAAIARVNQAMPQWMRDELRKEATA